MMYLLQTREQLHDMDDNIFRSRYRDRLHASTWTQTNGEGKTGVREQGCACDWDEMRGL